MKKRISRISILLITCSMLLGLAPASAFAAASHQVSVRTVTEDGTVKDTGIVLVEEGQDYAFVIRPNKGYVYTDVLLDGNRVNDTLTDDILYRLKNVTGDHTLEIRVSKTVPEEAEAALDQKAQEVLGQIAGMRLLTAEEKSGATDYIEQVLANGRKAVGAALTAEQIRQTCEEAVSQMESQLTSLKAVEERREAEEAASKAKAEEEAAAAKAKAEEEATAAKAKAEEEAAAAKAKAEEEAAIAKAKAEEEAAAAKAKAEKEAAAAKAKAEEKAAAAKAKAEMAKQKITLKKKTVSLKNRSVKLSWKSSPSVTGYRIYRKTNGGKYQSVKTVKSAKTAKQLSWTGRKLKKGKTYRYRIRAYRTVSGTKIWSPYSNTVSVKIR